MSMVPIVGPGVPTPSSRDAVVMKLRLELAAVTAERDALRATLDTELTNLQAVANMNDCPHIEEMIQNMSSNIAWGMNWKEGMHKL